MQSEIPKQFITIAGKPLLMHTIDKFHNYSEDLEIKLVIPSPFIEFWNSLCKRFDFIIPHQVIEGGSSRFFSVKNGMDGIISQSLVAIHDGVRPLVSCETIQRVFQSAEEKGNAVPVVNINESIRRITTESNIVITESDILKVETASGELTTSSDKNINIDGSLIVENNFSNYTCKTTLSHCQLTLLPQQI